MSSRDRPEQIGARLPLVFPPPFRLSGTRTLLFSIPCDEDALAALVSTQFEWVEPDIVVRPVGGFALLVLTDVARAECGDPALGYQSYREATFFVPVWGRRGAAPFLSLHVPFIYPDSGIAVANGREIFGLPKKPALEIAMPSDAAFDAGAPITVDVLGARAFDGSAWTRERLVSIEAAPHAWAPHGPTDLLSALAALGLPAPSATLASLLHASLIQLKQVPDVDPGGAPPRVLYRAVTRTHTEVSALSHVRLGDASAVRVQIGELASDPIRSTLGIAAGDVTPHLAMRFEMDFQFGPAEIWRELPDEGTTPARKTRVLVLGGGLGALATALALTDTEERRNQFEVRLVAQGHRLGGKGSSWRNPDASDRIEEHGIHVLFGFYHNFLRLLRRVYDEADRTVGVFPRTFDDAFAKRFDVVFTNGDAAHVVEFPETPPGWGARVPTIAELIETLLSLLVRFAGPITIEDAMALVLPDALTPAAWRNDVRRQVVELVDVLLRGVLREIALSPKSFDDFDDEDLRDWMRRHGASEALLDGPVMQVPYDGVFAYEGDDYDRPRLAAGMALRGLLRLALFYEEAPYYVMTAGMGECVFAPIYSVLRARGVRIDFFSKVTELRVSGAVAEQVTVTRQVELAPGQTEYEPLIDVGRTPCWPRDPIPAQLADPASVAGRDPFSDAETLSAGTETLRVGDDFDHVVCALPAPITASVLAGFAGNRVLEDVARIRTVATIQAQAWLDRTTHALG